MFWIDWCSSGNLEKKSERKEERRGRLLICYLFCDMCLWALIEERDILPSAL